MTGGRWRGDCRAGGWLCKDGSGRKKGRIASGEGDVSCKSVPIGSLMLSEAEIYRGFCFMFRNHNIFLPPYNGSYDEWQLYIYSFDTLFFDFGKGGFME